MPRPCSIIFAAAVSLAAPLAAHAQTGPDLGDMLGEAQRFTVKVRGTVVWPFAPEAPGTGSGTGFIIDREKGWILTNAHVVNRSPSTVEVAIGDTESNWLPADRIYVDNHLDIAVVKVVPDLLPDDAAAARLGCSQTVKQGETIVAYGHPISLNFTATRGIVSNVRTLGSQEFVQMDANINPGNSGGPLLAVASAEVIGINTLNIAGASGLGLAVAIRQVCPIVDLLTKGRDPSLPSIPVYWLKLGRIETLTVAARFPQRAGEPGDADAGLKPGDIVQALAGGPKLSSVADLYTALRGRQGRVQLHVLRDGKAVEVSVPLIPARPPMQRQGLAVAGMLIAERVTMDTQDSLLPPLRIEYIRAGEAAARAGFQTWDLLETIGDRRFPTVAALHDWLKDRRPNERVPVLVRRASSFDPRVTAEYHRLEIRPTALRLLTAGATPSTW
jgi:S1-C subfamily serine protease